MNIKNDHDTSPSTRPLSSVPLKDLSTAQFAALGIQAIAYTRKITGAALVEFVPEAASMPEDSEFHLVVAADGTPVLVTDDEEAVADWFDDQDVLQVAWN